MEGSQKDLALTQLLPTLPLPAKNESNNLISEWDVSLEIYRLPPLPPTPSPLFGEPFVAVQPVLLRRTDCMIAQPRPYFEVLVSKARPSYFVKKVAC